MKPIDLATLLLLAAIWGGSYILIRIAAPALGPLPLMFGRVVIAGIVLLCVMKALRQSTSLRGHGRRMLVIGLLNSALPFSLIAAAELHIAASLAAVLTATVPLFGAILAVFWLGERLTTGRAVGSLLGLAGVSIVAGWSPIDLTPATTLSIAAVLLGSLSYAGAGIYSKRALSGIPPFTLALGQQIGAAAWLAVPALLRFSSASPTPGVLGCLAALAVLATSLAFVLYFRLIARIGPTLTQTVTYLTPIFGMLWGALFLGERLTSGMIGGFICIIASIAMVSGVRPRMIVVLSRPAMSRHVA